MHDLEKIKAAYETITDEFIWADTGCGEEFWTEVLRQLHKIRIKIENDRASEKVASTKLSEGEKRELTAALVTVAQLLIKKTGIETGIDIRID